MKEKRIATSFDAFVADTSEKGNAFVETPSGWTFEIQAIDPGELMIVSGAPLIAALMPIEAVEAIAKTGMPGAQTTLDIISRPDFRNNARETICLAVKSLNFVNKPVEECNPEAKEVSVYKLPFADMMFLFRTVVEHSMGGTGKSFYTFRTSYPEQQELSTVDSQNGEVVREETVGNTVSS